MINATMKRVLFSTPLALGAALFAAQPVAAQYHQGSDLLYDYYYHSDSTLTNEVGHDRDTCNWYGVGRTATEGTATPYFIQEPWAYCVDGQLEPY